MVKETVSDTQAIDFKKFYSQDEYDQVYNFTSRTLDSILRTKSFVKKEMVIQLVKQNISNEMQVKPHFDELLENILEELKVLEVGGAFNYGVLTNQKILNAEKEILEIASEETTEHILDRKIVTDSILAREGITDEQTEAVWAACGQDRAVTIIEGTAGAGKSFTMKAVKESYMKSGYEVLGAALSWAAADVLAKSTGIGRCEAIEGILIAMEDARSKNIPFFKKPTLLLVDEAGLVDTVNMWRMLKEASMSTAKVKVILTGDSTQIPPVNAGNILESLVEYCGTTRIDTIFRQQHESHKKAVKLFANGWSGKALHVYKEQECLNWFDNKEDMLKQVVCDFISHRLQYPEKKSLILALSNSDVQKLNEMVRDCYKKLGYIKGEEIVFNLTDSKKTWQSSLAVGDKIVFRKNEKAATLYKLENGKYVEDIEKGIFNRTSGFVQGIRKDKSGYILDVKLDSGKYVFMNLSKYMTNKGLPINHNFAMTMHASQGQTVEKTFLVDSAMMGRQLAYVGMSRHTQNCEVYFDKSDIAQRINKINRQNLDYTAYSKEELLKMVAATWSKKMLNPTILSMLSQKKKKVQVEENLTVVEKDPNIVNEVDYIPEFNEPIVQINVEAMLKEKDPLTKVIQVQKPVDPLKEIEGALLKHQTKLLAEDEKRFEEDKLESSKTKKTKDIKEEKKDSVLDFFSGLLGSSKEKKKKADDNFHSDNYIEKNIKSSHQGNDGILNANGLNEKILAEGAKDLFSLEKAFLPLDKNNVFINANQELVFDGYYRKLDDNQKEIIKRYKDVFWTVGKNQEIRFLAKEKGKIVGRYSIHGEDKTGEGYPLFVPNPKAVPETPVYVIASPVDLLVSIDHFSKNKETKDIPHFVWGAKDAKLNYLVGGLKKRKVMIMRSKQDETQIPWALEMQKTLSKYGIEAGIIPKIENAPEVVQPVEKIKVSV